MKFIINVIALILITSIFMFGNSKIHLIKDESKVQNNNQYRCTINGLYNPGFENYNGCPFNFSQFDFVNSWINPVSASQSSPDYFNNLCGFIGFISSGIEVAAIPNNDFQGCARAGLFMNYNTPPQDPKYKEFIAQEVNLVSNTQYAFSVDLQLSATATSSNLERDFAVYGYNGSIPVATSGNCIVGATELGIIDQNSINSDNTNFAINFTPNQNFDYIILGPSCATNNNATGNGYIFIDNVILTSQDNVTLTPIIEQFGGSEDEVCCFSGVKEAFQLVGNHAPAGVTILWSQGVSNPETITFTTPTQSSTTINETGQFANGFYEFYYTFNSNGCSITDTMKILIARLELIAEVADLSTNCFLNAGNDNREELLATSPSVGNINGQGYSTWWSFIKENGSQHVFPNGGCLPSNDGLVVRFPDGSDRLKIIDIGFAECAAQGGTIFSYNMNGTEPTIEFFMPYDSARFIWNVRNEVCGEDMASDTTLLVHRRISANNACLIGDFDTDSVVGQLTLSTLDNSHFLPSINGITVNWTYTGGTGELSLEPIILNPNDEDSINVVFYEKGFYYFLVEATDGQCTWSETIEINILDIKTKAEAVILCNIGNSDNFLNLDAVSPNLEEINVCKLVTWWSFLNEDGSQHVFSSGNCIPDDGQTIFNDDGSERILLFSGGACVLNNEEVFNESSNGPRPQVNFYNPIDSATFLWHTQIDINDPTSIQVDTCLVVHRYIRTNEAPADLCLGDTVLLSLSTDLDNNSHLLPNWSGVTVEWSLLSGPSSLNILNPLSEDSIQVVFYESGDYIFNVVANDGNCSWSTELEVFISGTSMVEAADKIVCSPTESEYTFDMEATPDFFGILDGSLQTWWSVILDDDSEHIFPNGCVFDNGYVADGFFDGLEITASSECVTCAASPPDYSICGLSSANSPFARFTFNKFGEAKFIWHVNGCGIIATDTVTLSYQFSEPFVDAGIDDIASCQLYELQGNVSMSSAGNSGCAIWSQLGGPDSITILNNQSSVSYADFTDATQGEYYFLYGLGCGICVQYDTLTISVQDDVVGENVTLMVNASNPVPPGQQLLFTASGGVQYSFLVNNMIVQELSAVNTFSYTMPNEAIEVSVISIDQNGCINVSETLLVEPEENTEICDNGIDDDNDGFIDEEDPDCISCNASFTSSGNCTNSNIMFNASNSSTGSSSLIDTYTWGFGDGTTGNGIMVNHQYTLPGNYQVQLIVQDDANCSDTTVVDISVSNEIAIDLGDDQILCEGDDIELVVSPLGNSVIWQDGSSDSMFTVSSAGVYWVSITNDCGTSIDSIIITFSSSLTIDLGPDQTICDGDSVVLSIDSGNGTVAWQDGSSDDTYTVNSSGIYWASITDDCGTSIDSIEIFVLPIPAPTLDLGPDQIICSGDSIELTILPQGDLVSWQDGSSDSTYIITSPGIYWVSITNDCGISLDSIVVSLSPSLSVDLGADQTICNNDSVVLVVDSGNGTIVWQDGSTNDSYVVNTAGIYWASVTDVCGTSIDSVEIFVSPNSAPTLDLGPDQTICNRDSIELNILPHGGMVSWQDGSSDSTYIITTSGIYWVSITNDCGTSTDSIVISMSPNVVVDLGPDQNICEGESIVLSVNPSNGSIVWQDGSTNSSITVNVSGTYWVRVNHDCGVEIDSVEVLVSPTPTVDLGSDQTICEGDTIVLNVDPGNGTAVWQDGSLENTYTITSSGIYWAEVNSNNCITRDSIVVNEENNIVVELPNDTTLCNGDEFVIIPNSNVSSFVWQDGSTNDEYIASSEGIYWASAQNNCGSIRDSIILSYVDCDCVLNIPNAFSPNGDNLNDLFRIYTEGYTSLNIEIYNRWGDLVFSSDELNFQWDGTFDGEQLGNDVFSYQFEALCESSGETFYQNGSITIVK